jgi:molybdopterin/thiamine biosynthesis adenylyltransferase/rhodanese-related sulfurtransferase
MLTADERRRYQRHLSLPDFGEAAQERLTQGRVLVIGAGGLGCPALLYLAAAGVGRIVLIDPDRVDTSNLQRQILYQESDVGRLKVDAAAERLRALNHHILIETVPERFRRDNALDLVRAVDVVVDGSDNFATRYLVNDACVLSERPFVYGAISGFAGQLAVFNWKGGPTYRCLFPVPAPAELAPNCAEAGVLGVLPGIIGTWQATEAIKLLSDVGEPLSGKLLLWNALTMHVQTVALAADPRSRAIVELPPDIDPVCASVAEIDADELRSWLRATPVQLVDVREPWERAMDAILPSLHIPLGELDERSAERALQALAREVPTVVYCAHGVRSLRGAELLRTRYGFRQVKSLRGGMHAWHGED